MQRTITQSAGLRAAPMAHRHGTGAVDPVKKISPLAGKLATPAALVNVPKLVTAYFSHTPDASLLEQRVAFGSSGHRGRALDYSFNESHMLSISQAICDYRKSHGIGGPLYLGMDTHALSMPAAAGALEVLAANGVEVMLADRDEFTPTPVISHAILAYNRGRDAGLADGIVITPSHSPPECGGVKYNLPSGAPANREVSEWIETRANGLLLENLQGVRRIPLARAQRAATTHRHDFLTAYVTDLGNVLDIEAIRGAGLKLGVDPLGGAAVHYWGPIADRYGLNLKVVSEVVDPTFRFMTVDWDGKIRMDPCSSYAMQRLIGLKDRFDVAFACDTAHDRHGIVTPTAGLMPAGHYLDVATFYLLQHRSGWNKAKLDASLVRRDGSVWSTERDGIVPALLSAEIIACTGRDPGEIHQELVREFGQPAYDCAQTDATGEHRGILAQFTPHQVDDIFKIYAQGLSGASQLRRVLTKAQLIIDAALLK
jgi:phosphoglucomutase